MTGRRAADAWHRSGYAAAQLDDHRRLLTRADTSRGLSYHRLVNVAQWHVKDDNYAAARAAIVNAHHKHPMAAIWVWA
ncbi:MAG TPA: Tn3 family transposase [Acidisphaera sp.]|nr:Tn3 family transposase [Acidisphaera sp.]